MKGTLETRPMFVKTKEHIRAHLMTCFIALTMMRLMQRKIKAFRPAADDDERHWSYGMSGARLSKGRCCGTRATSTRCWSRRAMTRETSCPRSAWN